MGFMFAVVVGITPILWGFFRFFLVIMTDYLSNPLIEVMAENKTVISTIIVVGILIVEIINRHQIRRPYVDRSQTAFCRSPKDEGISINILNLEDVPCVFI